MELQVELVTNIYGNIWHNPNGESNLMSKKLYDQTYV
jgi:hypothetical protein